MLGGRQKTPCNVRSDGAATTHGPWFRRGKLCDCVRGSAGREAGEWFGSKWACLESPARDENPTEQTLSRPATVSSEQRQNASEIAPQIDTAFRSFARQFERMLRTREQGDSGSQRSYVSRELPSAQPDDGCSDL